MGVTKRSRRISAGAVQHRANNFTFVKSSSSSKSPTRLPTRDDGKQAHTTERKRDFYNILIQDLQERRTEIVHLKKMLKEEKKSWNRWKEKYEKSQCTLSQLRKEKRNLRITNKRWKGKAK
jgi:hypothetical protein